MAFVYDPSRQNGSFSTDRLLRHHEIRDDLKERSHTISGVVRDLEVCPATITTVRQGHLLNAPIEEYLTQLLGTTATYLVPERYQKERRQ